MLSLSTGVYIELFVRKENKVIKIESVTSQFVYNSTIDLTLSPYERGVVSNKFHYMNNLSTTSCIDVISD